MRNKEFDFEIKYKSLPAQCDYFAAQPEQHLRLWVPLLKERLVEIYELLRKAEKGEATAIRQAMYLISPYTDKL